MADQIGVPLVYPTNYDTSWSLPCNVEDESQYLLFGQPETLKIIDCEFLAPMLTPVLAGTIHIIQCDESFIKAIYDEPRFYTTAPAKHTRCASDRTCGEVVSTAVGPEMFQYTVEDHSIPIKEKLCGAGGCGSHPKAEEMKSQQKYMDTQMETFQMMIDYRFMKYIYTPVSDNLAVADATYATVALNLNGSVVDVIDYNLINEDFDTNITSVLTDANLAMGYDDLIIPTVIDATDLSAECICCLDETGIFRLAGHLQKLVGDIFRTLPADGDIIMLANYADFPQATLQQMRMNWKLGTVTAAPFAESGLTPDKMVSGHEAYNIGGVTLILSYMAPAGKVLVLPKQVRDNIQFAQSPFETQVNDPSGCDYEGYHLAKKAFGWFIPSCYRDKYFIIDMTGLEDCCKLAPCDVGE